MICGAWFRRSNIVFALIALQMVALPVAGEEPKESKASKDHKAPAAKPAAKPAHKSADSAEAAAPGKPVAPVTVAAVERKPATHAQPNHAPAQAVPPRPKPYINAALRHDTAGAPMAMATLVPQPGAPATVHAPSTGHAAHWSYEGETGPHAWAKLSPEWAKCGSGSRQSPIDIRDGMKVELDPVVFDYSPSRFRVIDNGHTVQANINGWNSMRVMGRRFRLVQFHFHSPSEEMVDGRLFDMVAHLVHKDTEGRLAVVAVLVERGARQPAIQTVLNNLPLERGEEYAASTPIDLNKLLPQDRRYFTYMGSLTTPPCTEDVLWIVMKQPVQATPDQLNLFARMYPMNARPIQDAGDRVIKESN